MRAVPEHLTQSQRDMRVTMGCDAPNRDARYAILCPRCDGTRTRSDGAECDLCHARGQLRGMVKIHQCPSSHITPDINQAMRAYRWADAGTGFPEPGGVLDQAPTFLQFSTIYSAEIYRVQDSERESDRIKSENVSKGKSAKKGKK